MKRIYKNVTGLFHFPAYFRQAESAIRLTQSDLQALEINVAALPVRIESQLGGTIDEASARHEHRLNAAIADASARHEHRLNVAIAEASARHEHRLNEALSEANARHELRLQDAIAAASARSSAEVQAVRAIVDHHLPQLVNVISSQNSFYRATAREVGQLVASVERQRVESSGQLSEIEALKSQLAVLAANTVPKPDLQSLEARVSQLGSDLAPVQNIIASQNTFYRQTARQVGDAELAITAIQTRLDALAAASSIASESVISAFESRLSQLTEQTEALGLAMQAQHETLGGRIALAQSSAADHAHQLAAETKEALGLSMQGHHEGLDGRIALAQSSAADHAHKLVAETKEALGLAMQAQHEALGGRIALAQSTAADHAHKLAVETRDSLNLGLMQLQTLFSALTPTLSDVSSETRHQRDELRAAQTQLHALVKLAEQTAGDAIKGQSEQLQHLKGQIDQARHALEERTRLSEDRVASLAQRLDSTSETIQAIDRTVRHELSPAVNRTEQRVEFVRSELLYEQRYGAKDAVATLSGNTKAIVKNKALVDKGVKSGSLRINVGCGHIPLPGYVNVDRRDLPSVDVVADALDLPFSAGSVDEIYSAHMLEHFPEEQIKRTVLPYFKKLLRSKGRLSAVVPDAEAMMKSWAEGTYSYADLRLVTFGAQDYDGDFHFTMFTPESLSTILSEGGFEQIEIKRRGVRNGACFEFEITAQSA